MDNSKKVKTIIISILAAVLVITGVIVVINIATSINFSKYIYDDIQVSGYNGYAHISETNIIDIESLIDDLGRTYFEAVSEYVDIEKYFYVDISETNNLENGDIVDVKIVINYKKINSYDFDKKLKGKKEYNLKYEVKGLTEQTAIDPFKVIDSVDYKFYDRKINYNESYEETIDGFHLFFSDEYDKNKLVITDASGEAVASISYSVYGTDNENVASVCISEDNVRSLASSGIVFTEIIKNFTLREWKDVTSVSEISGENLKFIKESALSIAQSSAHESWENVSVGNCFFYYRYDGISPDSYITALFRYSENGEEHCFEVTLCNIFKYKDEIDYEYVAEDIFGNKVYLFDGSYDELLQGYRADEDEQEIKF